MAKKKKQEVLEERICTIPLRSAWVSTRRVMRAKKAVNTIRLSVARQMHTKDVRISQKLNEALWTSGAKKPPGKVSVKISLDSEGVASVRLPEETTLEEERKKFLEKGKSKEGAETGEKAEQKAEDKKEEKAAKAAEEKQEEVKEAAKETEKK